MNEKNSNYNNKKMIDIAIMSGCKTIKDFAFFLKEYTSKIEKLEVLKSEEEMVQLSLLR